MHNEVWGCAEIFPPIFLFALNLQVSRFANLSEGRVLTFKTSFSDTLVHLALIFSIFPIYFGLFIHSYRLTGSNVFAQTKV